MTLNTFVLVGTVLSHDTLLATVEFNLNPGVNGGPAVAVLPNSAIPCEIKVGKRIFVVKDENMEHAIISCEEKKNESKS